MPEYGAVDFEDLRISADRCPLCDKEHNVVSALATSETGIAIAYLTN